MAPPALSEQWRTVKPTTESFEVNLIDGVASIDLPIVSEDGSVLYFLACRGGPVKALDELGERDHINWVGPFMCILNAGDRLSSKGSLLAEDDSPPWHTRGQFHKYQLVGSCGAYPEFGLNRSFRLRGFVLSFDVRDLELNPGGLIRRFILAVSVRNDPTAKGTQAERPNYLEPQQGNCDVIREGKDPRYCRIKTGPGTGSWALCPEQ